MATQNTQYRFIVSMSMAASILFCLLALSPQVDGFIPHGIEDRTVATKVPSESNAERSSRASKSVFADFRAWVETYRNESSPEMLAKRQSIGEKLAMDRRKALSDLIQSDPRAALRQAIPKDVKELLPVGVSRHLEDHMSGGGLFIVGHGCGPKGHQVFRQIAYQGKLYDAFVYGRGREQTTRRDIWIDGIAIGSRMALSESCLVQERAAEAIVPASLASLSTRYRGSGSPRSPWTTGTKTVLYMRLDYPDTPGLPISLEAAQQLMSDASVFYAANTYGRIPSMTTTVTPILRMPNLYGSYTSREEVEQDATTVGVAAGFDPAAYDLVVYQNSPVQVMSGFWAYGRENAKGVWMYKGLVWMHHCHEFGHNFGNRHANLWDTFAENPIGPGVNLEYGDTFDNMGNTGVNGIGHNTPWFKNRQGWLDDVDIKTVTTSGIYRVQALEFAPSGNWMALRITRDSIKNYWIFYRSQFTQSQDGAIISWGYNNRVSAHLLDMTPGTAFGINDAWDAPLLIGQTFTDWAANIQITVLGKGNTIPETLDIQVTVGPPNNVAPIVDAGIPQVIVLSGTSVTANLNGTVTDPDDVPITSWAAEGGVVFGNPQVVDTTATFSQPGFYELSLTADDGANLPISDTVDFRVVSPGVGGILLTNPEGGETWTEGSPASINWSSAGITNVTIELSRDGGWTWETLVSSTAASTGSWVWSAATGPGTNRCLVRIKDVAGSVGENGVSISPDVFTIVPGACPPTLPGDLDGDGDVDLNDSAILTAVLLGFDPDLCHTARADMDGNGSANGDDLQLFVNAFLGL